MASPPFIHLRVHSAYSLLEGAISLKGLVKWCKAQGMPAVAVTDSGNLFGSLEFSMAAVEAGIQPIIGCTLFIQPEQRERGLGTAHPRPDQLLAYAQNETGWRNLLALVSKSFLTPAGGGHGPLLAMQDIEAHAEGLIILTGGIYGAVGKALIDGQDKHAEAYLQKLMQIFPRRLYVELSRHGLPQEQAIEKRLIELAYRHHLPLVATNDAYFADADMFEAHDAFLCIADGTYVSEPERRRLTPEHRLKTPQEMAALFADIPEALANTVAIARRCSFIAMPKSPILPTFTREGLSEDEALRQQAAAGLQSRLENYVFTPEMNEEEKAAKAAPYRERLEFELGVIIKMKFPGYFLIVSDFITWSKEHGIPVGPGRGSGAGSVVAWALMITDLDPLRYGLLFERFLNPQRVSMPDFDVDFCQERREEVIRYVQERYGADRVAQIITFGKLQARAVLRDVGRVLQMPYGQVDKICKLVPNNPAHPVTLEDAIGMEPMLKAAIKEDETVKKLVDISLKLEGLNRHASTHAAGVVIGDRPLQELVPMYRDPKSDMPVVQYSMKYAEAAGLVKFDFLGLKTLTVLSRTLELLKPRHIEVDLLALPEGDKKTYDMLSRGETVGVFQLEGQGMRDTVKKLRPDRLEDIIALVSLYRPGPMDNIPTYIARKHGEENPEYLHPLLEQVLKETYGVIIYQEQVMQIAQLLAGYSLGEADLLRRAMGKKIRAEMEAQRDIFVKKAVERGVNKYQAASIFDLIAKFAEYGFNKSHAAAYALISYQTAYLKANYPVEFIAASMTYDMHNTDKLGVFREEASRFGIALLPPDINRSEVLFSVEVSGARCQVSEKSKAESPKPDACNLTPDSIRYALAAIRNVGAQAMQDVVRERQANGPFKDVFDFAARVSAEALNRRALEHLIKAGAFDTLHPNRNQLLTHIERILAHGAAIQRDRDSQQESLFGGAESPVMRGQSLPDAPQWPALEQLEHEFSAIGFYLSAHPLAGYKMALETMAVLPSSSFAEKLSGQFRKVKLAGIVTGRKFKVSDKGRFAFVQLSDLGGIFEVSVFNEALLNQQRDNLEPGKILLIHADAKQDEGAPRLIAESISLFDEALMKRQQAKNSVVRITVAAPEALASLRSVLGEPNGNGAAVRLAAPLENAWTADVQLPGKYAVSPAILDRIRVIKGVVAAEEIPA
ncbi:MAG: DNA polymerase III subunit alpha [Pseudomonadota bacterium]|nr:DNA polymerase III subunit alpha [Pseudomonadota bacterium]